MTGSSEADCSAPGTGCLPAPCGGSCTAHVRPAPRPPPGGHSPAFHAGDAPGGTLYLTRCGTRALWRGAMR
eukprot:299911-Prymnesium_polylepis.1